MSQQKQPKVKSLYKAIKLLDYFTPEHPERGVAELAQLTGSLKSTVHNIMQTFEQCGFITKNAVSGKYRLGPKIIELGHVYYMSDNTIRIVKQVMKEISHKTGEIVYFATRSEHEAVYIQAEYPPNSMGSGRAMGFKAPLYCTGVGKALLAFCPDEELQSIIDQIELKKFTPNTITDKKQLIQELKITADRGYAIDNMEHEYGIRCVAVPIKSLSGEVNYSMSITGPSLRMTDQVLEEYSKLLIENAKKIIPVK